MLVVGRGWRLHRSTCRCNWTGLQAEMNHLIQRFGRKTLVLVYQQNGVCNFYLKVHEPSLTPFWQAVDDQPASPFEEGGSGRSAEISSGSAILALGRDDTTPCQTESEEHETQVPIMKTSPKSHTPQEVEAHQASGHVQYESSCRHCVPARGIHQHRTSVEDDEKIPPDFQPCRTSTLTYHCAYLIVPHFFTHIHCSFSRLRCHVFTSCGLFSFGSEFLQVIERTSTFMNMECILNALCFFALLLHLTR